METPIRTSSAVVLAPPPCQVLPCQINTDPRGISGAGCLDRGRVCAVVGVLPSVAAGDDPSGAVGLREVGEGPHGVADRGNVWLGDGLDLVVGVDDLCGLARGERDRGQRRHQALRAEDALDQFEYLWLHGDLLPDLAMGQQVVGTCCAIALEAVVGGRPLQAGLEPSNVGQQALDQIVVDDPFEDRVAIPLEFCVVSGHVVHPPSQAPVMVPRPPAPCGVLSRRQRTATTVRASWRMPRRGRMTVHAWPVGSTPLGIRRATKAEHSAATAASSRGTVYPPDESKTVPAPSGPRSPAKPQAVKTRP